MQKRTAPVQCLLAGLLVAAVLLSPLAAQAAKTADLQTQNADKGKETDKGKDNEKDKDNEKEKKKPKVTVTLTSPLPGAVVTAPADIPLAVDAQSTQKNHPVVEVDFYQGTTLIGTSALAPFGITWRNVPAGVYTLTAVASNEKKDKEKDEDDDKDDKHDKLNPEHQARSAPVQIVVNAPPTVSLTAPAAGAVVTAPATLALAAHAADADGQVAKVDFYQGQTLIGTATQAPYALAWANAPAGSHVLTAVATDNRGASTASSPVPVIVNAPPTVSLTAPADNTVLFAPTDVAITAQASDADGTVAKVEFFQGQTLLGAVTQAPYAFTWLSAPPGTYSLTAKATDNRGASTVSAPAALTVDIPPSVSLTATAPGDLVAPTALALTANATDSDGTVAKVEFYQGNTLLGTATQAPYAFTWNGVAAGSYSLTAKATDNLGGSTVSAPVLMTVVPNQPPQVALTAPTAGQTFAAPATVSLAASASDADGQVAKVAFYQGNTLLGTAIQAPYAYTWSNVAAGSYTLTAQATDNKGATTVSSPLALTVIPAQVKGVFYIQPDHLGTPRVVTDESNKIVWRNDPLGDPFGAGAPNEDPDGDGLRFTLNLRFPGQYFDAETGLSYNYFRDCYDPATGRYCQPDPLGLAGGSLSLYTYANNAPTLFTDPLGLTAIPIPVPPPPVPGRPSGGSGATSGDGGSAVPGGRDRPDGRPDRPTDRPDRCDKPDRDNECEKKRKLEEGLCEAIAIQWGRQGVAICKGSAFTRYSECLRFGPGGVKTPLHGVDTPL